LREEGGKRDSSCWVCYNAVFSVLVTTLGPSGRDGFCVCSSVIWTLNISPRYNYTISASMPSRHEVIHEVHLLASAAALP
jgi:hypothetical protein